MRIYLPLEPVTLDSVRSLKNSGFVLGLTDMLPSGASMLSVHVNVITARSLLTVSDSSCAPGRLTTCGG